ncbi:MAG: restriction endonuclease subunit S [Gammaproteobacteria bacterium]|nr:restriction endonuclease subunit S [Gammaproteobacteria bacterium]
MGIDRPIDVTVEQRKTILALLGKYVPNTTVWVYGSRAKWTSRPSSDIDLVVFATPLQQVQVRNLRDAFEESDLPFRVDLFVWNEVPESFQDEIRDNHVVLTAKPPVRKKADWRETVIGEIADIVGGGTPATKNTENFDGSIPWLTPKDLSGTHNRYVQRGERNLSQRGLDGSAAKLLPANSVLLSTRAPIGYVALAKNPIATNQGFRSLVVRDGILPEFLYYWLKLNTEELERHASGSTFRELSGSALKDIRLSLPPFDEQRAIARILGTLDDKIELNQRMNKTLEAMAQALFKSWFVDFDPVRAKSALKRKATLHPVRHRHSATPALSNADPTEHLIGSNNLERHHWSIERAAAYLDLMNPAITDLFPDSLIDSEIGKIPRGWDAKKLGSFVCAVKGRSYRSKELRKSETALVTLKSFARGGGYRPEGLKSFCGSYKPEQVVKPGEIVIACTDVTQAADVIGRPAIVQATSAYSRLVASLDTLIIRPVTNKMMPAFLYFLTATRRFTSHTYAYTTGTTVLHLDTKAIPSFQFACPPPRLMRYFDAFARPALLQNQNAWQETESLGTLRAKLIPKLISGELSATGEMQSIEEYV